MRVLNVAAIVMLVTACSAGTNPERAVADEIDQRIHFYSAKAARQPRLYPVYVQLASAYFDKARTSGEVLWLTHARRSLHASMAIVATHEAFVTQAQISNYAHRFEDALAWGERALSSATVTGEPPDPAVIAILVEAHSALGQYDEARALLPRDSEMGRNFFTAVAFGGWLSSQRRHQEASLAYAAAAHRAAAEDATAASAWAHVMAAGELLDAGHVEDAGPHLEAGRRIDPANPFLLIHDAESFEARGQARSALAVVEAVLRRRPHDADLHAKAFTLARRLGLATRAQSHFADAERGFRTAIDAGEVYTLGALAMLLCDAGVRPAEARALAERNFQFRRDRHARELMSHVSICSSM